MEHQVVPVLLDARAADPEAAIRLAGGLLVQAGYATADYVEAMVAAYERLGSYIVLAPHVALPHARPESGAIADGIAVVRLAEPVIFGHPDNDPVEIVIPLVATSHSGHLGILRRMGNVLTDATTLAVVRESTDSQEIAALFTPQKEN